LLFTRDLTIKPTQTVASEFVRAILGETVPLFEGARLRVNAVFEANPDLLLGDVDLLRHALKNILVNAVQATKHGGVLKVRTSTVPTHQLAIEVVDTGEGISTDIIDRVFDPFFTTRSRGSGLGLTIAHKIVQAHGGSLEIKSKPGVGTVVRMVLQSTNAPRETR